MRELILGDIPEDYDPSNHQVLGTWCFFKKQTELHKYKDQIPNLAPSKEKYQEIEEKTSLILKGLLPHFTKVLNLANGTTYSETYWEVLIADCFIAIVSSTLECEAKVDSFILNTSENFKLEALTNTQKYIFNDYNEFYDAFQASNVLYSYLFYKIIEKKDCNLFETLIPAKEVTISGSNKSPIRIPSLKQKVLNFISKKIRIQSIFGFNIIQLFILNFILICKLNKKSKTKEMPKVIIKDCFFNENEWIELISKLLPQTLFKMDSIEISGTVFKKGHYICSNFKSPTAESKRVALMKENGVKIYSSQHGSGYGDVYSNTRNNLIELSQDGFFTWGWKNYGPHPSRLTPLSSPMLSKLKKKYLEEPDKDYIAVTSTVFTSFTSVAVTAYSSQFFPDYIERLTSMYINLNTEVKDVFYFRPRITHRELCFQVYERLLEIEDDVKFLEGDLDFKLKSAKLIIVDNPGSVLNKIMAAKIPTLICWNSDCWQMSEAFSKHLDSFKKVNIFFDDPIELSKHLNSIYKDIPLWWKSEEVQNAVEQFNFEFARTSEHPFRDWANHLIRI